MSRYQYVDAEKTMVTDSETGACIPVDGGGWQGDYFRQWCDEGNEPDPYPAPTFADYVAQFTPGLQRWMETVAASNGYDSVLSCVSYIGSSVTQFAGDAKAMSKWRDELWKWASAYQHGANGQLPDPIPTLEQIIAMAPQPHTYGWVVHPVGEIISVQLPPENPTS